MKPGKIDRNAVPVRGIVAERPHEQGALAVDVPQRLQRAYRLGSTFIQAPVTHAP
jgi:hypothetical protein